MACTGGAGRVVATYDLAGAAAAHTFVPLAAVALTDLAQPIRNGALGLNGFNLGNGLEGGVPGGCHVRRKQRRDPGHQEDEQYVFHVHILEAVWAL
jgi:hypothetical protein